MIDMYRISLLKTKIKSGIKGVDGIRFRSSRDRSKLFINLCDWYGHEAEVFGIISRSLSRKSIQFEVMRFGYKDVPFRIEIPIDQEALPERKILRVSNDQL